MASGQPVHAVVINDILGTSITETDLNALLNGPRLYFRDLSNTKEVLNTVKKSNFLNEKPHQLTGVYMFTHTPTNQRYIGSSIQLPIRLRNYFGHSVKQNGKFLPLFYSRPITEFSLDLLFLPYNPSYRSEMVVEQYYLLDPQFNLNTVRVSNNPSGSNAKALYMYDRNYSTMYFSSTMQIDFIRELNIAHTTFTKHLNNGTEYLGKYVFSRDIVVEASDPEMSLFDLCNMLAQDRIYANRNKISLGPLATPVILIHESTKSKHFYPSLGKCLEALKLEGHSANHRVLVSRLNTPKTYCGYRCIRANQTGKRNSLLYNRPYESLKKMRLI
jgi:hypothetical protein